MKKFTSMLLSIVIITSLFEIASYQNTAQAKTTTVFYPSMASQYLPNLRNGKIYQYNSDNNRYVLTNFPQNETDTTNALDNNVIANLSDFKVKLLRQKLASWGVKYYYVQFANRERGWVQNQDLHPVGFLKHLVNRKPQSYSQVAKAAFNYINYVRLSHGISKLKWDYALNRIANVRANQLFTTANHNNEQGYPYRYQVASQLGYPNLVNHLGENVAKTPDYVGRSVQQGVIQNLNAMLYEDSGPSQWGHRNNILTSHYTKIGVGIDSSRGMLLIAYVFE